MCGKGSQGGGGMGALGWGGLAPAQQQTIQASPEAMGWYRQAMQLGQQAVSRPYQQFGTKPEDFVAQLNAQQTGAQQGLAGQAAATQPYAEMAPAMAAQAGMGNAAQMAGGYMNPFMQQVVDPVRQAMQQQQGQQLSQQQTEAIKAGAFGGDRAGLQRQLLRGQQNLAMGQALSPLYQQGYGQALGAAQTDLARQLQAAQGLQGSGLAAQQASLGAGTLGQQTAQAGISALQQQFNQQQMWPYMQAQFLGGLAGGMGPLLGQQTYQARAMTPFGAFFADGGAVDDDAARMGGAVIDLEPGKDYYEGGIVPPGFATRGAVTYAPGDVSDVLRAQEAMYQKPAADEYEKMPTGQIKAAEGLKPQYLAPDQQQKTGLRDITGAAKDILGIGKDIYGMFTGSSDSESGGMGARGEEDAGGGFLSGLGSAALKALPYALAAFKEGGAVDRDGYLEGGLAGDDIFERGILGAESGRHQFDREGRVLTSPKGALGIAQIMPGTAPEAAKLAGLEYSPERLRTDADYNKALGRAYYNEQLRKFGTPELASAAYNAGPGRVEAALKQARATGRDVMSFLPAETRAYVPKVMGMGAPGGGLDQARSELAESRRAIPMGDPRRSFLAREESANAPAKEEGLGGLMSTQNVVPALMGLGKGLSSMMTAKTVSPGAAFVTGLGEGLAGGAESYMGTQKTLADIAKTRAEEQERLAQAGATGAEAREITGRAAKASLVMGPNGLPIGATIYDPATKGYRYMDFGELYRNRQNVNLLPQEVSLVERAATSQPGAPAATPAATAVETAKEVTKAPGVPEAPKPAPAPAPAPAPGALTPVPRMFSLGAEDKKKVAEQLGTLVGTDIAGQEKFFRDQEGISAGAATQKPLAAELATAFSRLPKTGPLAPGAAQPRVASMAEWANSIANIFGAKGPVNQADLATLDQINKLTAQLKAAATSANDQRALGALSEFEKMFPTGKATTAGIAKNLSAILMMNQKELDKIHYFDDWKKTAASINPTLAAASGAMANTTFNEKYNSQYDREAKQIEKMLMTDVPGVKDAETGRSMNWFSYLSEHGGDLSPAEKKLVESKFGDGILRYFTSVQR